MRALFERSICAVRRGIDLLAATLASRRGRSVARPLVSRSSPIAAASLRRNGIRMPLNGRSSRMADECGRKVHWSRVKSQTRLMPFRRAA